MQNPETVAERESGMERRLNRPVSRSLSTLTKADYILTRKLWIMERVAVGLFLNDSIDDDLVAAQEAVSNSLQLSRRNLCRSPCRIYLSERTGV